MDGTGTPTAINTFGPNGLLSRRTGGVNGPSVFYTFDPQGSVAQRFDRTGNLLSSDEYDAWGAVLSRTPTGTTDVFGAGAQWGYYTDGETGLLLLTHRYYDAGTGRFINRDPIGYAGGINLYGYVGNGPTNFADPLGLFGAQDVIAIGGGALLGAAGFFAGGGPLGAAAGFGLGAGLLKYSFNRDAGEALDYGLGCACVVGSLGSLAILPEEVEGPPPGFFGMLEGRSAQVSQKGIDIVESHIATVDPAEYNDLMLDRLRAALAQGTPISGADLSFYFHELSETTMVRAGLSQPEAHLEAFDKYGVSPFSVYHPDVIQAGGPAMWNEGWYGAWGLPR